MRFTGQRVQGKTTLTLHAIAEEQKKGGICAFVDAEHALDPLYASKLGVNVDELLISQPDAGEQALEITDTLVRSGAVSIVVVDSVCRADPSGRDGRRYGRPSGRGAGAIDVASDAQTGWVYFKIRLYGDFYQPDSDENWRYVWLARDNVWWQRVKILCFRAFGYPPYCAIKEREEVVGNATRVKVVKIRWLAVQTGGI